MKRFQFRIQGTQRIIFELDEFYMNMPMIDREIIYERVPEKDWNLKYEIYDSLLGKVVYKEGDEKDKPVIELTKEQQEMALNLCIMPNVAPEYERLAQITEKSDSLAPEVKEHLKKGYLRNMRKAKRDLRTQKELYDESFKVGV